VDNIIYKTYLPISEKDRDLHVKITLCHEKKHQLQVIILHKIWTTRYQLNAITQHNIGTKRDQLHVRIQHNIGTRIRQGRHKIYIMS